MNNKTKLKILAIIPARGGSKGVPHKNIRLLNGHPLITYAIRSALQSDLIDRVVVSTDDIMIGKIASNEGAQVLWRPEEISGDDSPSELALLDVLDQLTIRESYCPDILVFLQCTSPLTKTVDIEGTIIELLDQKADSAFAATPFHYFLWRVDPIAGASGVNHDKSKRLMRQQKKDQYLEAGAVYVMRTEGFLQYRHRFFGKTVLYIMPSERVLEIDDMNDFEIAELLIQRKQT